MSYGIICPSKVLKKTEKGGTIMHTRTGPIFTKKFDASEDKHMANLSSAQS
jgi:hypothetical protein